MLKSLSRVNEAVEQDIGVAWPSLLQALLEASPIVNNLVIDPVPSREVGDNDGEAEFTVADRFEGRAASHQYEERWTGHDWGAWGDMLIGALQTAFDA